MNMISDLLGSHLVQKKFLGYSYRWDNVVGSAIIFPLYITEGITCADATTEML